MPRRATWLLARAEATSNQPSTLSPRPPTSHSRRTGVAGGQERLVSHPGPGRVLWGAVLGSKVASPRTYSFFI